VWAGVVAVCSRWGDVTWAAAALVVRWPWWSALLVGLVVWWGGVTAGLVLGVAAGSGLTAGFAGGGAALRARSASVQRRWNHRKWARLLRRRWPSAMANAGFVTTTGSAEAETKKMPVRRRMRPHRGGVSVWVDASPSGRGITDFITQAPRLCNSFGALSLRAYGAKSITGAQLVRADFRWEEPFPQAIPLSALPKPKHRHHVVVGLDEDGRGLERNLALPSLIVAAQGGGKSTEVWTTLWALMRAGIPVRLRVFDPKGGTELGLLEDACWDYGSNPAQWPKFLGRACGAMQVRQAMMKKEGLQTAPMNDKYPLDLMVIDELVTVLALSRGTMWAFGAEISVKDAFAVMLSQGRSSGSSVLALSQLPEKDVIGAARGLFTYVSCLRVNPTEKSAVDMLLGQGAHNAYPAHTLQPGPETAGIGWTTTKTEGIIKYRGAAPTAEDRAEVLAWLQASAVNNRAKSAPDPPVRDIPRKAAKAAAKPAARRKSPPVGMPPLDGDGRGVGDA
jgi:hypothetical protein